MGRVLGHNRVAASAIVLAAISMSATAHAQGVYEVCNPYTLQQFRDQMSAMQKAFDEFDLNEARYQAETAQKQARCINEPVTPGDVGRFARLRAQMFFFDQKTDSAAEWMLVSLAAHGPQFPEDMGPTHPLRLVLRDIDIEEHTHVTYPGNAVPPKKGLVLHNGRLMQQPEGWEMVGGLVQVFDKKGAFVEGFWVEGASYDDDMKRQFVGAHAHPYKPPSWTTAPTMDTAPDLAAAYATAVGFDDEEDDIDDIDIPDVKPDTGAVADGTGDTPDGAGDTPDGAGDTPDGAGDTPDGTGVTIVDSGDTSGDDGPTDTGDTPPEVIEVPKDPDDGTAGPVKPPKDKPAKPPKPPKEKKDKGEGGVSTVLLSTGVGLAALGGAAYGIGFAVNSSEPNWPYTGDDLAARRSTGNLLAVGGAALGVVGLGVGVTALISDSGGGLRFSRRW